MVRVKNWLHTAAVMTSLPTWLPLAVTWFLQARSFCQDSFVKTVFFFGGGGGSSYMIPQNRVGICGLFLFHFYKTHQIAPKRFIQKYKLLKKIVKGRFQIKSFYIFFFEVVMENLRSGIQMVVNQKYWQTTRNVGLGCPLDNFYFKHDFKCSNLPKLSCILITMITVE